MRLSVFTALGLPIRGPRSQRRFPGQHPWRAAAMLPQRVVGPDVRDLTRVAGDLGDLCSPATLNAALLHCCFLGVPHKKHAQAYNKDPAHCEQHAAESGIRQYR